MGIYARHVHLDFHTTELLAVGERFDGRAFVKTLVDASVNSIVVFAKCHHGWCYYPTEVGEMHPQLKFDLLGEQVKACRAAGIRVIAYITGGWSASDAVRHPEWQAVDPRSGKPIFTGGGVMGSYEPKSPDAPKPNCTWAYLCMAGEYGEHMKAIAREVLDKYDVDGLFFDIMGLGIPCACEHCKEQMTRLGYRADDVESVSAYTLARRKALMGELHDMVLEKDSALTVFFNSGGAEITKPEFWPYSTHFEMENLASMSPLGYDAIVNRSKFFREMGRPVYGMTGKFHTDWGEFGGFKHPDALVGECAAMMAYGVRCNIGDQLHPSGEMNADTYRLIGRAFRYVEKLEDYIEGGVTYARLGLMFPENRNEREGYAKLLSDCHLDYRVVMGTDLSDFDCVLIPAPIRLSEEQEAALCAFSDRGGKLVLFGKPDGAERLLEVIGYRDLGQSTYDKDYIRYTAGGEELLESPVLMYNSAHRFEMDGECLAQVFEPYFSRTEGHYCSHRNTPNREDAAYPAIVKNDRALCFAHLLGEQYFNLGSYWCRKIFETALATVYRREIFIKGLPVYGRYTAYRRGDELLIHLLGLSPIKRGKASVLEEPVDLYNIGITVPNVRADHVMLVPEGEELAFDNSDDALRFTVPVVRGHRLIVVKVK